MRSKAKEKLKSVIWIPVFVAILTIALGIILSVTQNKIGWIPLLIALFICLLIFLLSFKIMMSWVCPISVGLFEALQSQIDRYVEKGAVTWMITNEQMAEVESAPGIEEVWLVTCDLAEDIPGTIFFDTVHKNLISGVRYRYFIPKSLEAEARANQLIENHGGYGDIAIISLSDDFFFLVPRLDFAIYDPMNRSGYRCGYMGLPLDGNERFHCKMEPQFVDLMIGKLQSLPKNKDI